MTDVRATLRRIGGPASVTWQGLLVAFIASVMGYLTGGPTPVSFPVRLGVVGVATLAGFVPLLVVHARLRRRAPRPRPALMLAMFVVVALVRGGIVAFASVWVGVDEQLRVGYGVFAATPAIVLALAITAIVVASTREDAARLAELTRVSDALAEARDRAERVVAEDQALVTDRIAKQLMDGLTQVDAAEPAQSAQALSRLSHDVVRPLSHQLAQSVPTWEPTPRAEHASRVRPLAVIAQVAEGQPFMEMATAAAVTAVGIGRTFSLAGPALSIAVLIVLYGGTVLALVVLNALVGAIPESWPRWVRPVAFVLSVVAYASSVVMLYWAVADELQRGQMAVISFTLAVIFVVLLAIVKSYGELQAQLEQSLRSRNEQLRWSIARARQVQWYQQRALSRVLHGPVQSAVNAAVMRLDAALRTGEDVGWIVDGIQTDLRGVFADVTNAGRATATLAEATAQLTALWSGLCDIAIDVDEPADVALAEDSVCRTMVIDIVTEGAFNAVRHGRATRLRMHLGRRDDVVHVCVQDNGGEPTQRMAAGLGSRLLDECAVAWARERTEWGNRLTADLPVLVGPRGANP